MKSTLKLSFIFAFLIILISACSEKKSEIEIKPKTTTISGDLAEYYSIVDGSYKLSPDEKYSMPDHYQVKIQIKRTDKAFDFDPQSTLNLVGGFNLFCDLLDEQTAPVIMADRDGMITQGSSDGIESIAGLKPGETGWLVYHFSGASETIENIKLFSIDSKSGKNLQKFPDTSSEAEINGASSSADVNCDQFIKDYEAFANSYVILMKKYKANPSDTSIMSEYSQAAQKALDMQKNASLCSNPEYASKLIEIANKIAKASV
jgi:hypothetical protein